MCRDVCPHADCVVVNVNCHELTANLGELIFLQFTDNLWEFAFILKPLLSASGRVVARNNQEYARNGHKIKISERLLGNC